MNTQSFLSMFVFFVFIALAVIHLYWFAGGKWALNVAFPTKESGEKLMKFDNSLQTKLPTLAVAVGLTFFGLVALELGHWLNLLEGWATPVGYTIAGVFALRALGDFNYLGLFKKVKSTPFAQKDSSLYVPLCLFLSITLIALCL
ncbi:DUF3995 domain-containing protein [Jiulongibacter sediminis]|uniref:DUF3995 domain-containing protein n=1 Tax=Jiulongibacter sediminis TaxID=1605367 RepID=A0A0P7BUX8_9BACT|nr:DUF3995 domain-containing protein [Jiulongibacter sediminis]KPM48499.1 hypothetical protein AFM12_07680 [Jiulongibacter sediminis]TBX25037.1 hypothetical protein TK44_07685 [Jiulongibacter sediminis]